MKPVTKLAAILVGLALVLPAAGCVQVPVSGQWDFGIKKASIYGQETAGQEFYVSDRNLTRIDIFLYPSRAIKTKQRQRARRPALQRLKGKNLTMDLYSLPKRERLATISRPVGKIRAARMYSFTFKPIGGSKHRRYYFELKAPDLTSELAVAVRLTDLDRYKDGTAFANNRQLADADLGFQAYINMTSIILVHSVASRLAADPPFMVAWGLIVLLVLAAAVLARRRERGIWGHDH